MLNILQYCLTNGRGNSVIYHQFSSFIGAVMWHLGLPGIQDEQVLVAMEKALREKELRAPSLILIISQGPTFK